MLNIRQMKCPVCNEFLYFQPQLGKKEQTLQCCICCSSYKLIQRNKLLTQLQKTERENLIGLLSTLVASEDEQPHYLAKTIARYSLEKLRIQSLRKGDRESIGIPSGTPWLPTAQLKIDKEFLELEAKKLALLYQIREKESLSLIAFVNSEDGSRLTFKVPQLQPYVAAVLGGGIAYTIAVAFSLPAVIASIGLGTTCGFSAVLVRFLLRRRRKEPTSLLQHLLRQAYTVKEELQTLVQKQVEQEREIERYRLFQHSLSDGREIDTTERAIALLVRQQQETKKLATKYQKQIERLEIAIEAVSLTEALPSADVTGERMYN